MPQQKINMSARKQTSSEFYEMISIINYHEQNQIERSIAQTLKDKYERDKFDKDDKQDDTKDKNKA